MKRTLDIAFATLGLLLTAPAWLAVPLAIKMDDGGPVFYGQERVGKGGRHFRSWKFRSMRSVESRNGPVSQARLETARITRVGRVLRPTALDELPQLWSILKGDMSLVGPRALAPLEVMREGEPPVRMRDVPGFDERHSIRPGLTGLAQTRLRPDAPHSEKFEVDLDYVRDRSLLLDIRLIIGSVWTSLRGAWPEVGRQDR